MSWYYCWKCLRAFKPVPYNWHKREGWTVKCKWDCTVYPGGENFVEARPMPVEYSDILESTERLGGPVATRMIVTEYLNKEIDE